MTRSDAESTFRNSVEVSPDRPSLPDDLIRRIDESLLQLTVDQLRTFVVLCRSGSVGGAVAILGRQQTSIVKQLRSIEKHLSAVTGEPPLIEPLSRGGSLQITRTGVAFRDHAERIVEEIFHANRELGMSGRGFPVRVGLTDVIIKIPLVRDILEKLPEELRKRDLPSQLILSRIQSTKDVDILLNSNLIDYAFAMRVVNDREKNFPATGVTFTEFFRDRLGLLSNKPLKIKGTATEILQSLAGTIVSPDHGSFYQILNNVFPKAEIGRAITLTAGIHFGIDLIRFSSEPLCMLMAEFIYESAIKQATNEGNPLSYLPLSDLGYSARVGLFRREGDLNSYSKNHPLRIFQEVAQTAIRQHDRKVADRSRQA